jgi:uncharacterized membrane protein
MKILKLSKNSIYSKDGEKDMFNKVKKMLKMNDEGFITQGLNTFVVVAITLVITVIVISQVISSSPLITSGVFNTTQSSVNSATANALNLAPILLLIIIAVLVISAVNAFSGRKE